MNIKSYMTFLSRNKVYTAINVFGLSVVCHAHRCLCVAGV